MASQRFLTVCFILLFLFSAAPRLAADDGDTAGIAARVRGRVTAHRAFEEKDRAVTPGTPVRVGDIVTCAAEGAVQIVLTDDSFIQLLPGASVFIKQYDYTAADGRRTAVVKVPAGRVRLILSRRRSPECRFTVETAQAVIAMSLADVFITAFPDRTEVINLGRPVNVINADKQVIGGLTLTGGSMSVIEDRKPPAAPAAVSPDQRRMILKDAQM